MRISDFQKQIKNLVAQDLLNDALERLGTFCQENKLTDLENKVILNKGLLDRIDNEKLSNSIEPEDYQIEKNKINANVLRLVDSLEGRMETVVNNPTIAPVQQTTMQAPTEIATSFHDKIFVSIILFALVAFLGAFFYLSLVDKNPLSGSVFLVASAMDCLVYLNWKKKAQIIQAVPAV